MINTIEQQLKKLGTNERAIGASRFFKTGAGQYGEGDIFLGATVPQLRIFAKNYYSLSLPEITKLLESKYHEVRFIGVLLLVEAYKKYPKKVFDIYVQSVGKGINNWDLIDVSADRIVGSYISTLPHAERSKYISTWIKSSNLWKNRMVIIASFYQIKNGDDTLTYYLAPHFLTHTHDLIHKAVGWMLRECGKRVSEKNLVLFLDTYYTKMPRTMLRYAIERLPENIKRKFMAK